MTDLNTLTDSIISEKPEVSPFADTIETTENVATMEQTNAQSTPQISSTNSVENFDPTIHSIDEFGKPRLNKDGSLAKKRGRKSGQINSQIDTTQATEDLQYKNAAAVTVQMIVVCGYCLGGEEWQAESSELFAMNQAWMDYYKAKGITDIPPWIGVGIATGAYALPRFQKPKTKSTLGKIFEHTKPYVIRIGQWLHLLPS